MSFCSERAQNIKTIRTICSLLTLATTEPVPWLVGSATALSTGKTVASGALSPAWFLAAGGHALAVPKRVAVLASFTGSTCQATRPVVPLGFLAAGSPRIAVPVRPAVFADVAGSTGGTTVAIVPFRLIPTGSPRFTIPVSVAVLAPVARSTFGA